VAALSSQYQILFREEHHAYPRPFRPDRDQIAAAGMKVIKVQDNPTYQFISDDARGASKKFGVKSISLLAVKR